MWKRIASQSGAGLYPAAGFLTRLADPKSACLLAFVCILNAAPKPLFNGKNLDGWKQCNGKATYKVEKGEIVGTTVEGSPNSFLCTEKEYGDFILEFEVKTDPALNSGVQIRSHLYATETTVMTNNGQKTEPRKQPAGRVHGYQVEVANEASSDSGGIYDEAGRGWLHKVDTKAFHDNQWNKYRVEANGDHITTSINGVPCADLRDPVDQSGFIALQVHAYKGEKPAQVRFRNIRMEDLGRHTWKPLFDGKTMNGWTKKGPGNWTIEDGALHARSVDNEPAIGFLVHDDTFKDATIRVRFKMNPMGNSNSGFFIRADETTYAGY